jgi:F-type H+-transporting ATPase subunit gamma
MRLVAAAKVRKAQEAVTRSLPFSEMLDKVAANLMQQLSLENIEMPILEQRPLRKVTLVSITGDRGLCGPYNSAMIKLTEKRAQELEKLGIPYEIIPVGKKGTIYFKRREQYSIPETFDCPQNPTAEYAKGIADMLFQKYVSGETDRVEILYSKFESLIATTPTIRTMLPLSPAELAKGEDGKKKKGTEDEDATKDPGFTPNMVLDQEPATLLNVIVPLYVNGQVLKTIQDAVASELASRMTAMQSASDNARDLLKELGLVTNRARQAEVTQSIMEVVAGANAGE